MDYVALIQTLTAVGTLGTAIVILWLQVIRPWLYAPKLKIDFRQEEPYCKDVLWVFQGDVNNATFPLGILPPSGNTYGEPQTSLDMDGDLTYRINAYWIRLKVTNNGGSVAKNCEGQLTEVRDKDKNLMRGFVPVILRWSSRPDIGPIDINKEAFWFLDILFINQAHAESKEAKKFSKYVHICDIYRDMPTGTSKDLEQGEYYLKITVYGDNFKPKSIILFIDWKGKWERSGAESIFCKKIT